MRCMATTSGESLEGLAPDSSCSDDAQSVEQHAYDSCMAVAIMRKNAGRDRLEVNMSLEQWYVPGCDVVRRKSAGFWLSPESGRCGCQQREGHGSGWMERVSKAEALGS